MKALAILMLALFATPVLAQSAGETVYLNRCAMCHAQDGEVQGPNLAGVIGRKAGSAPGYNYTAALKASGITWTPETLDKFLTNPSALVPGTAMAIRVNDAAERAAVTQYLSTLK